MKIKDNQLSSHLQKNLAPCYLVTGDEHLIVSEALDTIRSAARKRGFTSRDLHVATAGFDWAQLRDSSSNLSLLRNSESSSCACLPASQDATAVRLSPISWKTRVPISCLS